MAKVYCSRCGKYLHDNDRFADDVRLVTLGRCCVKEAMKPKPKKEPTIPHRENGHNRPEEEKP